MRSWNWSYDPEAARAVFKFAFDELNVRRVHAPCYEKNMLLVFKEDDKNEEIKRHSIFRYKS